MEILQLVEDGNFRKSQLGAFNQIYNDLGPSDGITNTASLALRMLSM